MNRPPESAPLLAATTLDIIPCQAEGSDESFRCCGPMRRLTRS